MKKFAAVLFISCSALALSASAEATTLTSSEFSYVAGTSASYGYDVATGSGTLLSLGSPASSDSLTASGSVGLSSVYGGGTVATLSYTKSQIVAGASSGNHAIPYGLDSTTPYLSVYGGGSATFSLTQPASAISFVWGSVDSFNSFSVTTTTGTYTLSAAQLGQTGGGSQIADGADFVTIGGAGLGKIESFTLGSTTNSFEAADFRVSPVPVPGALPLFGTALAGIAALARRRAKKSA